MHMRGHEAHIRTCCIRINWSGSVGSERAPAVTSWASRMTVSGVLRERLALGDELSSHDITALVSALRKCQATSERPGVDIIIQCAEIAVKVRKGKQWEWAHLRPLLTICALAYPTFIARGEALPLYYSNYILHVPSVSLHFPTPVIPCPGPATLPPPSPTMSPLPLPHHPGGHVPGSASVPGPIRGRSPPLFGI